MQSTLLILSDLTNATLEEHGAPFNKILKKDVTCVKIYALDILSYKF